jgi:hypothetical protein
MSQACPSRGDELGSTAIKLDLGGVTMPAIRGPIAEITRGPKLNRDFRPAVWRSLGNGVKHFVRRPVGACLKDASNHAGAMSRPRVEADRIAVLPSSSGRVCSRGDAKAPARRAGIWGSRACKIGGHTLEGMGLRKCRIGEGPVPPTAPGMGTSRKSVALGPLLDVPRLAFGAIVAGHTTEGAHVGHIGIASVEGNLASSVVSDNVVVAESGSC